MEYQVRLATRADAPAISDVVIAALRQSNARDYPPEVIAQVEQSFCAQAIGRLLVERQVYVAALDQRVVATASLDGNVVRSVFVAPEQQGLGIGKQLMSVIQSVALGEGNEVLYVPSSITAEGFYATLGFQKVRDEFHGAERTIVMHKRLREEGRSHSNSERQP